MGCIVNGCRGVWHRRTIQAPRAAIVASSLKQGRSTMLARVPATATEFPDIFGEQNNDIDSFHRIPLIEFSYKKGTEIFGEKESADYVYQVMTGAVRSYKLLSDGRRQIGSFHLGGDIFGLEIGTEHRFTADAIVDTTVRLLKRRSLEMAAEGDVLVAHNLLRMTT